VRTLVSMPRMSPSEEDEFFAVMRSPNNMHPRPWRRERPTSSAIVFHSGSGNPTLKIDASTYSRPGLRELLVKSFVEPATAEFERAFNELPSGMETEEALGILAQGRYRLELPWKLRFSLWRQRVFGGRKAK
jgi:hypothetical protein